jgi:hypothetical protein
MRGFAAWVLGFGIAFNGVLAFHHWPPVPQPGSLARMSQIR